MTPDKLIQALAGGTRGVAASSDTPHNAALADSVFVEKLASAVDFIFESLGTVEKAASAEETSAPAPTQQDIAARLRERLHARAQAKAPAPAAEPSDEGVLGKLIRLRSHAEPASVEDEGHSNAVDEDDPEDWAYDTNSTQVDDEVGEKAASASLTLAEVLEGALQANELEQVVREELPKTASVRGIEGPKARKAAINTLKQGLMAKLGKGA